MTKTTLQDMTTVSIQGLKVFRARAGAEEFSEYERMKSLQWGARNESC